MQFTNLDASVIRKASKKTAKNCWTVIHHAGKTNSSCCLKISRSVRLPAGFRLLKIVHVFGKRETVLFAFLRLAMPKERAISRSLYNEKIQSVGRT
jgi:hypothetical protein